MMTKRSIKNRLKNAIFGGLFAIMALFGLSLIAPVNSVYAEDETRTPVYVAEDETRTPVHIEENTSTTTTTTTTTTKPASGSGESCEDSLGALGWLVCPTTGKIAEATDWLYDKLESILIINPVEAQDGSPIYEIWKYVKGVTNVVFIILFLIVIYSQITGVGISNYGIKKILPKMIVVAILVNLSFIICSLAVDASNIVGNGLRGIFTSIEESTLSSVDFEAMSSMSTLSIYDALQDGAAIAIAGGVIAFETGSIWMLIPLVLGAIVSVASGLITIALRQAVVALLIMISPLAIVAYMLPNTEQWFKKWRQLLTKMLVFYPMFSLLFGASNLAGWAIISSAKDGFFLLVGIAVQIFPLFFSWKLMKMSGTFLEGINARINGWAARPLAANRAWADSHRELTKQRNLASSRAYTPSLRLMQYLSNRKIAREEETAEHATTTKLRGQAYAAMRNYRKDGTPSREGEESYELQARNMQYQRSILRHKNNMNKGMGQLEAVKNRNNAAQIARLNALDNANVEAADALFAESARSERIDQVNATGRHKRFEDAINAHMDAENRYIINENGEVVKDNTKYKLHFAGDAAARTAAEARYQAIKEIMEGNIVDTQYAAASAAHAFDTHKKILETKMQKYFELTAPTKDIEYRLGELTQSEDAIKNIDAIISGMRILNQRGDTDLVKKQLDYVLEHGIELGTHASQSLASFLMFEVKDNDPFLRRFGKYINLETANVYNDNNRKVMNVTYDEYIKGYHDGENDLVTKENQSGRMFAKKDMKKLVEGTSLDNVERTAFGNLDDSLKKAYGYEKGAEDKDWDVKGYLKKREEIQTAIEPAFLSSSLKWLSGSEQINSGVKFWTGYELKQKKKKVKDENGVEKDQTVTDKYGNPVYYLAPSWEGKEFAGHEEEVEKYFRKKTYDYFKDQTTGQILGMRTDYRDPTMEHLIQMYLNVEGDEELSASRKEEYERRRAEIESRVYSGLSEEKAEEQRAKDLKNLKMEFAGRQLRKILSDTGKLEQIYRTRRSGAANNAKDWLRGWVGLDDEIAINDYLERSNKKRKQEFEAAHKNDVNAEEDIIAGGFNKASRAFFSAEVRRLYETFKGFDDVKFYEESVEWVKENLKGVSGTILKKYKDYYEANEGISDYELMEYLQGLLNDPNNY
ncbi:hypothetical protein IJU85_02065 [Candidatus Saccharibacteria bacterium]|nr:hypothetical protein [Candidatus Saccharibacteria bacterium]